jgi:uncharacterized membrane protein YeaQ/YmgE (transglycosylase-associated protein family)
MAAFCGAPRSSPTMLLCQHLGWDPWGRKVCCGRRGSARAKRIEAKRPHCAITAAIIGLIYGYDLGSIASALLFLVPAFDLSTFMTSVVTSAVVLGQLFGALFAGRISNTIGRKRSLALVSFAFVYVLAPETKGRPLEAIRSYWYNSGRWPEETST